MSPTALAFVVALGSVANFGSTDTVPLSGLDLTKLHQGWGRPAVDRSVEGNPIAIGGRTFARGVGSHAPGVLRLELDGRAERFGAWVGVDDETQGRGSVSFTVYADGRKAFESGVMRAGDQPVRIDIDLTGVGSLVLVSGSADDGMDFDHADWADAQFVMREGVPIAIDAPDEPKVILTPTPGPEPRINGPEVFAVRPGRPVLYRVPATGDRPMNFEADALPAGLTLDPWSGIISGTIADGAEMIHPVTLRAVNDTGRAERGLRFVVGPTLALTPPMGWNSWYIHYNRVTDADMRAAADAMIDSGMADFGYSYVNIDDCWMVKLGSTDAALGGRPRAPDGTLLPNARFPDMPGLADYIHAKGLKAGLYTSPGPSTCAGFTGAWEHEAMDAALFAAWGFDFLKYDWCSYERVATGEGRERFVRPYRQMRDLLEPLDRDIVFNLCQYGMGDVWEWGGSVGQCWRTTGDLGIERGGLLPGFYSIGLSNARHGAWAGPGAWNDPDYILLGWVGDARGMGVGQPSTLTGNEQYSYMSMWCLMAAPLIFSGDMTRLDAFSLNILCNAEVIGVDQDTLGVQGRIVRCTEDELILAKPLADGSIAVGLFNLAEIPRQMTVTWDELGVEGGRAVRDLWRQAALETAMGHYQAEVPRHGVSLVRLHTTE